MKFRLMIKIMSLSFSSALLCMDNSFAGATVPRQDSQETVIDVPDSRLGPVENDIDSLLAAGFRSRSKRKPNSQALTQATLKLARAIDASNAHRDIAELAQVQKDKRACRQTVCNYCITVTSLGVSVFSLVWGIVHGQKKA